MNIPEQYENDVLFFFNGRPRELELYRALFRWMEEAFPDACVQVQKSQISFRGRHLFAMVSLPRRKKDSGLLLSFGLSRRLDSPRVAMAVEPYPGRWTHHVPLPGENQLDGELLGWLQEAWSFGESKR